MQLSMGRTQNFKKLVTLSTNEVQTTKIIKKIIMKTLKLTLLLLLSVLLFSNNTFSQSKKDAEKELKSRAVRSVRKEAKKLKRDGYYVAPGELPVEKQLEYAWIKSLEEDESGYPKYILATGNAVAETQTAAKLQANEIAKFELAGTIATNVAALIESNIANAQLNTEEAASVTEVTGAIKNIIAQEIGRIIPLLTTYKNIGKNIEVVTRIAYSSDMATEAAKKILRSELKEKTRIQHEKLEKLMNF